MSDIETVESAPTEEDPAAAFLAREQDDLAALEGDEFVSSETPAVSIIVTEQQNEFAADAFGAETPAADPTSEADAAMFDPLAMAAEPTIDGQDLDAEQFESAEQQEPNESDLYTAIKQVDTQRAEPEKIRLWRENQAEMLIKKDAGSEEKKGDWRDVAKKELEDWYKHRDEQLDKNAASNKEGEALFINERDENIPGHEWERICRLCDFNPKASRTCKDISRMRSILLQLKQSPIERS